MLKYIPGIYHSGCEINKMAKPVCVFFFQCFVGLCY